MTGKISCGGAIAGVLLAMTFSSSVALADGMRPAGSVKDAAPAADEGRKFDWSWNFGATSNYIFRGISQSASRPAVQGGADMTWGIFYAGFWSSHINFGRNGDGSPVANVELDLYAGIKPVLGPVTFDLGFIYYAYPGANDRGAIRNQVREQDYLEGKIGASATFIPKLTTSITAFLSPQYTGGSGFTTTLEGTIAYELPAVMKIVPTLSGTYGTVMGDARDAQDPFLIANGKDSYAYWNAGVAFAIDKLTIDLRYWDTDIANTNVVTGTTNFCSAKLFNCESRFVGSAKVTF